MAASIVDEMAEALATCSICRKEYNEEERAPLFLPDCRHVFCLACLATLAGKGGFPCPLCRQKVTLGSKGVQGLNKDFMVLNTVSFVQMKRKMQSKGMPCTDCPEKAMALYRCQDCRANMCGECNRSHNRTRQTRTHRVVELSLLLESIETFVKESEMCSRHEDKAVELYCRTCHESLCTVCHPVSHQGHNIAELKRVYEEAKAQKQDYDKKLLDKRTQIETLGERQEAKMKTLQETQAECIQQINNTVTAVREDLNKREKELLECCGVVFQKDLDRLQEISKKICQEGDEVTKVIDHNSDAQRMTRPSEFIAVMQSEDQHIKHVLSRPETQPVEGRPLGFHCEGLQPLRHGISQLGEVRESVSGVGDMGIVMEMFGSLANEGRLLHLDTNQFVADVTKAGGPSVHLSVEKADRTSCNVTATTLTSLSPPGSGASPLPSSRPDPFVHLSVEKVDRRYCNVTTTPLTYLPPPGSGASPLPGCYPGPFVRLSEEETYRRSAVSMYLPQSDPQPKPGSHPGLYSRAGLVRYPGTLADLSVTADTKVLFSVEVSVQKLRDAQGNVAEVAIGPRGMEDKSESVCERGGTGVRCYMRPDGSLGVEGWSQGRKQTDTTITDSVPTGQTRKLTLAFLVKDSSLTVYNVDSLTQRCELENIQTPGQLYLGLWQSEMAKSQLTIRSGHIMVLRDEFLKLLSTERIEVIKVTD